ncbi:MAG: DEAD/DEAH box helicase [Streptosporangiaceae bacterium]
MQRVVVLDIDLESVEDVIEPATFARGVEYANRGAVIAHTWAPSLDSMSGVVSGSRGAVYRTSASFRADDAGTLTFQEGACNCPVGHNCKHVVALVLTMDLDADDDRPASPRQLGGPGAAVRRPGSAAPRPAEPAQWERSLRSLLDGSARAGAAQPSGTPLAIELTLRPQTYSGYPPSSGQRNSQRFEPGQPATLDARLVQRGKNGGWIAGQLSWGRLESMSYYGDYSAAQVGALRELYTLYRTSSRSDYYYGRDEKRIPISSIGSSQLWPILDEAAAAGVQLVHASKRLGAVRRYDAARVSLDIVAGQSGSLIIRPVLGVDGVAEPGLSPAAETTPLLFIGASGHGIVCADRADLARSAETKAWPFWLARLDPPAPPGLQRMVLAGDHPEVPRHDLAAFTSAYYPQLRRLAGVTSSDGAFTAPVVSGPGLLLRVRYRPGHRVQAGWEWTYQVDGTAVSFPPGTADESDGMRDEEAERAILADLAGAGLGLERFGLLDASGARLPAEPIDLRELEAMRFSTELLPLLAGRAGLSVDVTGDPADYREASDLVSIAVSASEVSGEMDWYDLGIAISVDGRDVPFTDVFVALARGDEYLLLDDGAYFSLAKPELRSLAALIEEARALSDAPPGELRISRFQAGLWEELTELGVVSHQADAWQRQVSGLLSLSAIDRAQPPPGLSARLRPYQLDGFEWLAFLWQHRLGGILADDMGLGKTLQALALIQHARRSAGPDPDAAAATAPFLIVAPTSVVPNWVTESARFTPELRVAAVTETQGRRGEPLGQLIAGADIVVTSYTLLRIDFEGYAQESWSGLILDEAQMAKNHKSKIYQCARRLPAPFKLAITGTPMENNLMELWSLLSITAPGLFPDPKRFSEYYARPIERQCNAELLGQLRSRIRPLMRRRTKEQVAADLPAKQEQVLEVDLHPRHRKLYQTHLQRERQKVLGMLDDINANRFTIFRSLTLLRQLSLHAGLVAGEHADMPSAKVDVLVEQLADVIGGGHRALVFSQFTGFLGKVRDRLAADQVPYCYLDGRTRDRARVIERFRNGDAPVFLISLKAGGFGLNLTEADYCFLLDPWWNPATEAQAVDRTHRIGQTRNVMVYRLIARDTIEEKVMALKERKADLFASVLGGGDTFAGGLDAQDIRGLFA